jgi:hypothetical protein
MSTGEVLRLTDEARADLETNDEVSPTRLLMEIASRSPDFTEEQMAGVCSAIYEASGEDLAVAIAAVRSGKFVFEFSDDDGLHWRITTPDGTVLQGEGDL